MNILPVWASWTAEIADFIGSTQAVAVGIFHKNSHVVYLNAALRHLLKTPNGNDPQLNYLIRPSWESLYDETLTAGIVYEGWLTFEGPNLLSQSLWGQVWRRNDSILLLASYNVEELNQINHQIFAANSQITNLQRDLARKTSALQETLIQLRKMQALLIHSEKMSALGQLTAGMAHEINNPLAFIIGNLQSLQVACVDLRSAYVELETIVRDQGTEAQRYAATVIRQNTDLDFTLHDLDDLLLATLEGVKRIQKLVENLRTFSRLDEAARKKTNLTENIANTLTIAQPYLQNRVDVSVELDPLPSIMGYPAELNQVFLNLIINAAQSIEGIGHLTIQGFQEGDTIVLRFIDTGQGMTYDVLQHIFEPFFTTKPVGIGTGLGLTIAYRIITEMHRGEISAVSTPGQGSTFTIRLPLDAEPC